MREYLLVFLVALSVTYLLTVVAREIALRTGAVAAVRDRDVHAEPIPYLGGLAMLGGLAAAYVVAQRLQHLRRRCPERADHGALDRPPQPVEVDQVVLVQVADEDAAVQLVDDGAEQAVTVTLPRVVSVRSAVRV